MERQEMLSSLLLHLPDGKEDSLLLQSLLDDAAALICALTWRETVPAALHSAQVRLTVIMYNRMGMEGEKEHTEGDIKRAADDLPEGLRREIFAYRKAIT